MDLGIFTSQAQMADLIFFIWGLIWDLLAGNSSMYFTKVAQSEGFILI